MKLTKKLLCLFMSIIILLLSTVPAFASNEETLTEEKNDNYNFLLEQGFSNSFLNNLNDDFLQKIVDIIGENEVGNIDTHVTKFNDGSISTLANINKSSLTLDLTVADIHKKDSTKIEVVLVALSWEWAKNKPIYRGKDAITVNWDPSVLTYGDNFAGLDRYKSNESDDWSIFNETDVLAASNQGAVGYWTDLKAFESYVGGLMLIGLIPTSPIYTGTDFNSSVNVEYAHAYLPITGLSFSAVSFGLGLSWNTGCDTMADSHLFKYSK